MERAPLRPVPGRPNEPVADADAVNRVASALPGLGDRERAVLGLVVLAGRPRAEVGRRLGLDDEGIRAALARARKELRRAVAPLAGSGWCERAERLISDRLDGGLDDRSAARLDVHLRNCPRCVEHERRLVQATDALIAGVVPLPALQRPASAPAAAPAAPPASSGERAPGGPAPDGRPGTAPLTWRALLVVAVVLAMLALALAVAVALGASL
jgi:Putative zinc-finger/Sigma-70, region 4